MLRENPARVHVLRFPINAKMAAVMERITMDRPSSIQIAFNPAAKKNHGNSSASSTSRLFRHRIQRDGRQVETHKSGEGVVFPAKAVLPGMWRSIVHCLALFSSSLRKHFPWRRMLMAGGNRIPYNAARRMGMG